MSTDTYYLVGHDPHTRKRLALGPYTPGSITDAARGRQHIIHTLSGGNAKHDSDVAAPDVYRVDGANDPDHAWRKVQAQLARDHKAAKAARA